MRRPPRVRPSHGREIFLEAGRTDLRALEREHHARIATDVAQLLLLGQVARNQLVALDADPDAGHLWRAVATNRDEMPSAPDSINSRALSGRSIGEQATRGGDNRPVAGDVSRQECRMTVVDDRAVSRDGGVQAVGRVDHDAS